jgi:hypothetical protein
VNLRPSQEDASSTQPGNTIGQSGDLNHANTQHGEVAIQSVDASVYRCLWRFSVCFPSTLRHFIPFYLLFHFLIQYQYSTFFVPLVAIFKPLTLLSCPPNDSVSFSHNQPLPPSTVQRPERHRSRRSLYERQESTVGEKALSQKAFDLGSIQVVEASLPRPWMATIL